MKMDWTALQTATLATLAGVAIYAGFQVLAATLSYWQGMALIWIAGFIGLYVAATDTPGNEM